MESQLKVMADNVLKRMEEGAVKKKFMIENPQEWYFTYGVLIRYILHKSKMAVKEGEFNQLVVNKRKDRLVDKLVDMFEKCYVGTKLENDFIDGIIFALLAYKFDAEEEKYDGREAFTYGKASEEEFGRIKKSTLL